MLLGPALEDLSSSDIFLLTDEVELFLDVIQHAVGTGGRVVATDWLALSTDEELLKIPSDVMLFDRSPVKLFCGTDQQRCAWTSSLEERIESLLLCTIAVRFPCHSVLGNKSVARPDMFQPTENHFIAARFLQQKLIRGDCQHVKVFSVEVFLDCIPVYILLVQPSVGCRVEDDHDLPPVLLQAEFLSTE